MTAGRDNGKLGWLPRTDRLSLRDAAYVVTGAGDDRLGQVLRLARWVNTTLGDYRPSVFADTELERIHARRVKYWTIQRGNRGWQDLAALGSARLIWRGEPARGLDARAAFRIEWIVQITGARFVLVVPEAVDLAALSEAIPDLRRRIAEDYLATAVH